MIINLENILKRAEENLLRSPQNTIEDHLSLFKRFLTVEEKHLMEQHRAGADGITVCRSRSYLIDVLISRIYTFAAEEYKEKGIKSSHKISLIATGGYGRSELNPFSDIDIMFIYENKMSDFVKYIAEKTLYTLWDVGLTVGHGVRSCDEAVALVKSDVKTCSALLESRFIAGDRGLAIASCGALKEAVFQDKTLTADFIAFKIKERSDRHARFGASMYLQEPNIKECIGGLRDIHNIFWLATLKFQSPALELLKDMGHLTAKELQVLEHSYDFLLKVRTELHYTAEKKIDILTMPYQKKIAYNLGFRDTADQLAPELFMKDYYTHARNVAFVTQNLIAKFKGEQTAAKAAARRRAPKQVLGCFLLINSVLYLGDRGEDIFPEDPLLLLRVFLTAQKHDAVIHEDLRSAIRNNLALVDDAYIRSPEAASLFLSIFETPGKIGGILRQMNEIGFLGKFVPEFGRIVCLVQDSYYHKYTADEHTLVAIENIDELFTKTDKYRDICDSVKDLKTLYLALLLHDIGKPAPEKHTAVGCELARAALKRLPLTDQQAGAILFLVKEHLTLPHIAQRRDLDDEKLFVDLAKKIGEIDTINMLMLLTYADAKAVAPGLWTDWKESLIWELYIKTKLQMTGMLSLLPVPGNPEEIRKKVTQILSGKITGAEINAHLDLMPHKYQSYTPAENIAEHLKLVKSLKDHVLIVDKVVPDPPTAAEITVCTHDRIGLFSLICGSFTLNNINILSAQINTRGDGIILDTFRTTDEDGDPNIDDKRVRKFRETLTAAVKGEIELEALIKEHQKKIKQKPFPRNVPTMVTIDNSISDTKTVIDVESPDKLGLLHAITHAIAHLSLNISFAKIHTERGIAFDVFYVTGLDGSKITDEDRLNNIKATLQEELERE
jgi:[protein-PII] uridylyltransferase